MAYTLNRRLAQLVDSNGQLNTGKIPDNEITQAKLHSSFTVTASHLGTSLTPTFGNTTVGSRLTFSSNSHYLETGTNAVAIKSSGGNVYLNATNAGTTINNGLSVNSLLTANNGLTVTGNITTTGYLAGPATFTIDPAAVGDNTGTVVIAGNLQVDGTTTTINSTTVNVDDLNIQLATGAANAAAADGAGITVDGASATITYNATNDEWSFNKDVNVDGAIGIGTTNPTTKLHITSAAPNIRLEDSDTNSYSEIIYNTASGGLILRSDENAAVGQSGSNIVFETDGSEKMRVKHDGKVGIGTSSPLDLLHLESTSGDVRQLLNAPTDSDAEIKFAENGTVKYTVGHDAASDNFVIGTTNVDTEQRLVIDSSGNVGIGTTSPNNKLTVSGASNGINITGTSSFIRWNSGDMMIRNEGSYAMGFHTYDGSSGQVERMRIDSSGLIGIGTSTIRQKLHQHVTDSGANYHLFTNSTTGTGTTDGFLVGIDGDEKALLWNFENTGIKFATNNSQKMLISADGKVGIGASNPDKELHLLSSSINKPMIKIESTGTNSYPGFQIVNDAQTWEVSTHGGHSDALTFYNGTTHTFALATNGNVGIGDTTPDYNLHVSGTTGIGITDGGGLRLLPTDASDTDPWILYQYNDNTLRYNFTGSGADEIIIKYPNATNATTLLVDTEQQRVGIGTTSPLTDLHIWGTDPVIRVSDDGTSGYSTLELRQQNTTTEGSELMYDSSTGHTHLNTVYSGGELRIATNTGSFGTTSTNVRMTIASDGYVKLENSRSEYGLELNSAGTRSGLVLNKPGTSTVMGSLLMLSDETYRLGTASNYHIKMDQSGNTYFGNSTNYSHFNSSGNLLVEQAGGIYFKSATTYDTVYASTNYSSQGYTGAAQNYWHHLYSRGGTHITINTDGGVNGSENGYDDFVVWQGTQDSGEPLFRVSNAGRVIAKRNYEIGDHKTNKEEFGVNAINTIDTATSDINTTVTNTYENRSGVYWLNFNSKKFRAFVRPQWLQGRNWVLAAKFFAFNDMPSGSALWTNDDSWNGGDFDLNNGHFSKYGKVWRYFGFTRLAMQMGDRVAPIMQFSSTQTLYGAFSGGYAANGGGVTASSTDPQIGNNATYHGMTNYVGPNFTDLGGAEEVMQSYGLNKWANVSTNSTSANNQGTYNKNASLKGFQLTVEDSHPNVSGNDSLGRAGAWIGCPLDEGGYTFGGASSNNGADSGFGFGGGCGNNARTWTSGVAEWARGNEVANYLPGYIWLSVD